MCYKSLEVEPYYGEAGETGDSNDVIDMGKRKLMELADAFSYMSDTLFHMHFYPRYTF